MHFERKIKTDGVTEYYTVKDEYKDTPIYNWVRGAHGTFLPKDYIFEVCADLDCCIADYDEVTDEAYHEIADNKCAVLSNQDLYTWLQEVHGEDYVDQAQEEGLIDSHTGTMERLRAGYYQWITEILNAYPIDWVRSDTTAAA